MGLFNSYIDFGLSRGTLKKKIESYHFTSICFPLYLIHYLCQVLLSLSGTIEEGEIVSSVHKHTSRYVSTTVHCKLTKLKNQWGRIENGTKTYHTKKNLFAAVSITFSLRAVKHHLSHYINTDVWNMVAFNLMYICYIL